MRTAGGGPRRLVGVIPLGLLPGGQSVWAHGYSLTLDLAANTKPAGDGGSWFRPSQAIARELERETRTAGQHVYASTRFFVAFEVGLAPAGSLAPYYRGGRFSEAGTACPFASHGAPASSSIPGAARFTGKLREQLIVRHRSIPTTLTSQPVTIGSVAEPAMDCLASRRADPTNTPTSQRVPASPTQPPPAGSPALHTAPEADQRNRATAALREEALESRTERAERVGDDGEEVRRNSP